MNTSKHLILSAFDQGLKNEVPIWFMRQAGRYLPEYRDFRKGKSFEEMAMTPEYAAEVTLQPIRRFDLDAAIIFSDILIPLYSMNRGLEIIPQKGPVFQNPISNAKEITLLQKTVPKEDFPYLRDSIEQVRKAIPNKALFGFAGAPFTLASYLLEGKSTRNALITKTFAYNNPEAFYQLLHLLTDIVIDQLNTQIDGGVDVVQLFDSWAGFLSPNQYRNWILPHVKRICKSVSRVPLILYARGSSHLLPVFMDTGATGISVDSTISLTQTSSIIDSKSLFQGNLDPAVLLTKPSIVENTTKTVLDEVKGQNNRHYIFNLAQGIDKHSKLENVEMMVKTVKSYILEE